MIKSALKNYGLWILIIFHAVGLVGMTLVNLEMFSGLTPLNLLLSVAVLTAAHKADSEQNLWGLLYVFLGSTVLGYLVELLGTKTGFPFGNYWYGSALGPQLFEVPLIIGVNWFLMLIASGFIAKKLVNNRWLQVLLGAFLMTLVDVAIEPVASTLDFWYWEDGVAPLVNYAGWYAVALVMQGMFQLWIKNDANSLAISYWFVVLSFFVSINLLL